MAVPFDDLGTFFRDMDHPRHEIAMRGLHRLCERLKKAGTSLTAYIAAVQKTNVLLCADPEREDRIARTFSRLDNPDPLEREVALLVARNLLTKSKSSFTDLYAHYLEAQKPPRTTKAKPVTQSTATAPQKAAKKEVLHRPDPYEPPSSKMVTALFVALGVSAALWFGAQSYHRRDPFLDPPAPSGQRQRAVDPLFPR